MGQRLFKAILLGTAICATSVTGVFAQDLAGPYLAGQRAISDGNFSIAGPYFVKAMAADASNLDLKQSALVSFVSAGDFSIAASIASVMPEDQATMLVTLVKLVDKASEGDFASASAFLPDTNTQLSPILWGLLDAWLKIGAGDIDAGLAAFDAMADNETVAIFGQYHKGLALAYLGDYQAAADILNGEDGPLHLNRGSIVAHVQVLAELGLVADAVLVLDDAIARGFNDEQLVALREDIASGKEIRFTQVGSPTYGMAEAFVTIAEAMSRNEPNRTTIFYARLAQQLRPEYIDATLLVAEMMELEGQYQLAEAAYASIPKTSYAYKDAEAGRAEMMRRGGDVEGATEVLEALVKAYPRDVVTLNALGEIYRGTSNFAEAEKVYTQAIEAVEVLGARHWVLYYSRGIANERLDNWPQAEADFRAALALSPDQPFVLNYLGYSFIEMNINLEEAQGMIETAVAGMPDNGFITDSLAWVLYRLGKFEEAVAPMERAAELLPVDPIVNDHLGDVLWMVGRKTEAAFQWRRALSFGPEEEDLLRIKRKLEVGLDVVLEEEANN